VVSVQKWSPIVELELSKQKVPLPRELILAVIRVESQGQAGLVNPKSGASGLMQIMPITLKDYNQRHKTNYTLSDMRKGDPLSARAQIKVGIATLAHFWRSAYKYLRSRLELVPVDELAHIADLFYTAGPGATIERLNPLSVPTWALVQAFYPKWNALPHPVKVLSENMPWNLDAIGPWLEQSDGISKIIKNPKTGFALGIVILMAIYWLMKGKGNVKNES